MDKQKMIFSEKSDLDIGDSVQDSEGHSHVVTDILIMHFVNDAHTKFLYQLDDGDEYTELVIEGEGSDHEARDPD